MIANVTVTELNLNRDMETCMTHNNTLQIRTAIRQVFRGLCLAALALSLSCAAGCGKRKNAAKSVAPRNLLLITVDGLDTARMGCYQKLARTTTPVLDGLALAGILMEDARATSTISGPAHMAILSGQAVSGQATGADNALPQTLATLLQAQGFRTAAAVANPAVGRASGLNRGFELFDAQMPPSPRGDGLLLGDDPSHRAVRDAASVTRAAGDLLVSALTSAKQTLPGGKRSAWFLWVNYADALPPYRVTDKTLSEFFPDQRDAATAQIDNEIGKLFQVLEMADAKRDTLVVVAGGATAPHLAATAEVEGRVPLIIARKKALPSATRLKTAFAMNDLPATLTALLGARASRAWSQEQDHSAALLAGTEPSPRPVTCDNPLPALVFGAAAAPSPQDIADYLQLDEALRQPSPLTAEKAAVARRLSTAYPKSALLAGWQGVASLSAGDAQAAEQAFRRAGELAPDSVAWPNNLALALYAQNQVPQGLDLLDRLHEKHPGHQEVRNNLIRLLLFAGDKLLQAKVAVDALACYSRVIQIAPAAAAAYAGCGRAHAALGQREQALAAYRHSLKLDPRQRTVIQALKELEPQPAATGKEE